MKKILAFLIMFETISAFAAEKTMILGGSSGWDSIKSLSGVTTGKGRYGYDALQLVTSTQSASDDTDLLITFDGKTFKDSTGRYKITKSRLYPTADAIRGKGAAVSRGASDGLTLKGDESSIFGRTGNVGSFTIEFWLCPSIAESGESVFEWRSSLNQDAYSKYQMITASFFNNHLQWVFTNIFSGYKDSEIVLSGYSNVIPKKWSRHTLSFDDETGLLEYCIDGKTEALLFVTSTGHEEGNVCYPYLGVKAGIEICPSYSGKIDNFRIEKKAYIKNEENLLYSGNETFKIDGGKFVTEPLLVSPSATMNKINTVSNIPDQTEIRLYVRSGDNCYGWTENNPAWKEVVPGEKITGVKGLYFQVMGELLPDGGGARTPNLTQVEIQYTEQDDPLPPFTVYADAGDESVTLSWSNSVDNSAGGYLVYYGNRPGEYLGRVAAEGSSPVRVGNTNSITLHGLKNGTIYYFAVAAYSKVDGRILGTLSKEVHARPSERLAR